MKKTLLALAILGAVSGTAFAQSSVTVFGTLDVSLRSVTNDGSTMRQMGNSGYSAGALGFRGVEDLGDGLAANFWLEGSVGTPTGTMGGGSKFFDRRSTVGLSGKFGEVRLGRDLNPSYLNLGTFDAFGNLGIGANYWLYQGALGSGVNTLVRTDNAVSYFTPANLGGFYAHVSAAPGQGTPGNYKSARVGYSNDKLNVAAAVGVTGTASGNDFKLANVGASYDFGMVKVLGIYNQETYGTLKQNLAGVGALVPVGDFWQIRASAQRATAAGAPFEGNMYALGGVYLLSKRTAFYGTASRINNNGFSNLSVNNGIVASSTLSNRVSSGYEFGIRHGF